MNIWSGLSTATRIDTLKTACFIELKQLYLVVFIDNHYTIWYLQDDHGLIVSNDFGHPVPG